MPSPGLQFQSEHKWFVEQLTGDGLTVFRHVAGRVALGSADAVAASFWPVVFVGHRTDENTRH